jgi:hypothetical protein
MGKECNTNWGEEIRVSGFGRKLEGKRPLAGPRHRREIIKMDLRKIRFHNIDWIYLAQERDQRKVLVNMVMKVRVQ